MISLRDYTDADFDGLYRLDRICFEHDIAYTRQELYFFIHRPTAQTILALDGDEIVGFLIVDHERQKSGHVITIDVAPDRRQQGIGHLLMDEAERRSQALQRKGMLLEVAIDNLPAVRFYRKRGYVKLRDLPNYYRHGKHALLMGKNL
jgi:[ribosomal protein S18]-alanine N-acetyltransferase